MIKLIITAALALSAMGSSPFVVSEPEVEARFTREHACMAYSVYRESHGMSLSSIKAVAQIHVNRLRNGQWGDDMCKVILAPYQFSWVKERGKAWTAQQAEFYMSMAKDFMSGRDRVKALDHYRITHFHNTSVEPHWASKLKRVGQWGTHIFYKS